MNQKMTKREGADFKEIEIQLAVEVMNKTRDIFSFFKYLKEERDVPFSMLLIKSDNLRETILKTKRETDVCVDLGREDISLMFLPITKENEADGFIRRMMAEIKEDSGDFASILEVKKNFDLEKSVYTLMVDYFMILKQPVEWRTGQISYNEI